MTRRMSDQKISRLRKKFDFRKVFRMKISGWLCLDVWSRVSIAFPRFLAQPRQRAFRKEKVSGHTRLSRGVRISPLGDSDLCRSITWNFPHELNEILPPMEWKTNFIHYLSFAPLFHHSFFLFSRSISRKLRS